MKLFDKISGLKFCPDMQPNLSKISQTCPDSGISCFQKFPKSCVERSEPAENGREIDFLDDKSELAHYMMLINLLQVLGAIKNTSGKPEIT